MVVYGRYSRQVWSGVGKCGVLQADCSKPLSPLPPLVAKSPSLSHWFCCCSSCTSPSRPCACTRQSPTSA